MKLCWGKLSKSEKRILIKSIEMHFEYCQRASFCVSLLQFSLFYAAVLNCMVDTQRQSATVLVTNGKLSGSCIKYIVQFQLAELTFTCIQFEKKNGMLLS